MSIKADRDIEKSYAPHEVAAKLRRLADAVESGKPFVIQIAGERVRVPADAVATIEHERGDGEEEIEFQLRWTRRTDAGGGDEIAAPAVPI